jgi:hypothetical protein
MKKYIVASESNTYKAENWHLARKSYLKNSQEKAKTIHVFYIVVKVLISVPVRHHIVK